MSVPLFSSPTQGSPSPKCSPVAPDGLCAAIGLVGLPPLSEDNRSAIFQQDNIKWMFVGERERMMGKNAPARAGQKINVTTVLFSSQHLSSNV